MLTWAFTISAQGSERLSVTIGPYETLEGCESARARMILSLDVGSKASKCEWRGPQKEKRA